jgi:hypothetical protein
MSDQYLSGAQSQESKLEEPPSLEGGQYWYALCFDPQYQFQFQFQFQFQKLVVQQYQGVLVQHADK